jgi:hypothetical protein
MKPLLKNEVLFENITAIILYQIINLTQQPKFLDDIFLKNLYNSTIYTFKWKFFKFKIYIYSLKWKSFKVETHTYSHYFLFYFL